MLSRRDLKFLFMFFFLFGSLSAHAASDRYEVKSKIIIDKKNNLVWTRDANLPRKEVTEEQAEQFIEKLNLKKFGGYSNWRIPTITEFDTSFDFAVWQKGMEEKNHRMAKKIGITNFRSGYYYTSSMHLTSYMGHVGPARDYSTGTIIFKKINLARFEDGWWIDKGFLWPIADGCK